jgi:hypothetical protein
MNLMNRMNLLNYQELEMKITYIRKVFRKRGFHAVHAGHSILARISEPDTEIHSGLAVDLVTAYQMKSLHLSQPLAEMVVWDAAFEVQAPACFAPNFKLGVSLAAVDLALRVWRE